LHHRRWGSGHRLVSTRSRRRSTAMRVRPSFILLALGVLLCASCAREKSTDQMISDLKSHEEKDRLNAVRTLPQRSGDAARTVPALIAALKDHEAEIRRSA